MLTRRGFAGFASCALCGITEFIATEASAQGAAAPAPAPSGGVTRKIRSRLPGHGRILFRDACVARAAIRPLPYVLEKGKPIASPA